MCAVTCASQLGVGSYEEEMAKKAALEDEAKRGSVQLRASVFNLVHTLQHSTEYSLT